MAETVYYGDCECCGATGSDMCLRRCESTILPTTLYATLTNVRSAATSGETGTACPDLEGLVIELTWTDFGINCAWAGTLHIEDCEGDTGATISVLLTPRTIDAFMVGSVSQDVVGDAWPFESSAQSCGFTSTCDPFTATAADCNLMAITSGQRIMGMPDAPCCPDPTKLLWADIVFSE